MAILEDLSNELLFIIFGYFDVYQLYFSFGQLNSRFSALLTSANVHFDLDSIPLNEFPNFALLLNTNHIVSFTSRTLEKTRSWLFADNEVLQKFSKIRAITLHDVSYGIINRLHERLPSLKSTLIYANIADATKVTENAKKDEYIYFKHWCPTHEFCSNKFPNLRYLIMDTDYNHNAFGCLTPTISTIKYFKVGYIYSIIWLLHLFRYSPQLRVLHIEHFDGVLDDDDHRNRYPSKNPIIFPCALNMHILVLKNCYCAQISIEYILRACPHLKQLYFNSSLDHYKHDTIMRQQIHDHMFWQSIVQQWGQHLIVLNIIIKGDNNFIDEDLTTEFWQARSWLVKSVQSPPHFTIQTNEKFLNCSLSSVI